MKSFVRYKRNIKSDIKASVLLLMATLGALSIANSSYQDLYNKIIFGDSFLFRFPINEFINDFLMFFFFLNIGLEIKENILYGNLSSLKSASFPIVASIGGVVIPGIIFILFNLHTSYIKGFCIPISTDIAFAIGVFYIFKNYINPNARLFLLTLAVVDDLISIIVIAVFFTNDINLSYFFYALLVLLLLIVANKAYHVESLSYYILGGLILWYFIKVSNIHPTISGILLAISIPSKAYNKKISLLEEFQQVLVPFTSYVVIPLFAFVNSGISLTINANFQSHESLFFGILFGLAIGKPLGIMLFTYIFSKLKLVEKPASLDFQNIFLVSLIAGIGFTMSIFMCELTFSYDFELINTCKFAILTSCLTSLTLTSLCIFFKNFKN